MAKLARNGRYTRVPAEVATATLNRLTALGWTSHAIASATGVHYRTIDRGLHGANTGPTNAALIVAHGDPTEGSVGATGTRRRLQGLAHQGYDLETIAAATGVGFSTLAAIRSGATNRVRSRFYTTIRDWTTSVGITVGPSIRARQHAERMKWPSLFAWDDIDDIDERPQGLKRSAGDVTATRAAELEHMAWMGDNLDNACATLGLDRETLRRWCSRTGHSDLYERLAERSRTSENQYTTGSAVA